MPDKVIYEYATIRLVPKVEREEFLNVGVILFSKRKKFLAMKFHLSENRVRSFSEEIDIDQIRDYLNAWKLVCAGSQEGGPIGEMELPVRFRWLTANRSTIIQSSAVHPGLCEEPHDILESLFKRLVV